jgi:hypothetical protein
VILDLGFMILRCPADSQITQKIKFYHLIGGISVICGQNNAPGTENDMHQIKHRPDM